MELDQSFSTSARLTFWEGNSLLWEAVVCILGMFSSILAIYPLEFSSNPQLRQQKMSLDITTCTLGGKIIPG